MLHAISIAVLAGATIANGLLAGVFFAFAVAVSPGFRRVGDGAFVHAFRAINAAILNGWFLSVFMAAPLLAVASVLLHLWHGAAGALALLLPAAVCSILTFAITAIANVPLNQRLDRAVLDRAVLDRAALNTDERLGRARRAFETAWHRWNIARMFTGIAACAFLAIALIG